MTEFFGVLLLLIAGAIVALTVAPLRRRRTPTDSGPDESRANLIAAREAALQTIRDLDFDYQLGNLAEDDYRELRERHRRQAIAYLKATNGATATVANDIDTAIEQAVQSYRGKPAAGLNGGAPAPAHPAGRPEPALSRAATEPAVPVLDEPESPVPAGAVTAPLAGDAPVLPGGRAATLVSGGQTASRRPVRWIAAGGALAAVLIIAVAGFVAATRQATGTQQAIGQLPTGAQPIAALAALPGTPGTLLAATPNGLLVSADGGQTWQPAVVNGSPSAVASGSGENAILYAAGVDALARSDDGGLLWTQISGEAPGGTVRALAVAPDNPDTFFAAVAGRGILRSDNGGANWQVLAPELPGQVSGLVAAPGGYLYLATADQGVLVSRDGRGWANASGFVTGALPTTRVLSLASDPRSGDTYLTPDGDTLTGALYAGTAAGLFKSIDGGTSWAPLPLTAPIAAVAVDPADSRVLWAVDAQGQVFRSADRGQTWKAS